MHGFSFAPRQCAPKLTTISQCEHAQQEPEQLDVNKAENTCALE